MQEQNVEYLIDHLSMQNQQRKIDLTWLIS